MICENCSNIHDGNYGSGRFCSRFCSSSFSSNKNKELKNKKISESLKGRFTGLESSTYKSDRFNRIRIEKCPICALEFNKSYTKIYCSRACYLLDKDFKFRKKISGGYRKGSGIGKKGWYKGYWCDSSWELAFVIYNIDNNIKFERNKIGYDYLYKGKKHKYYPDYLISNVLHEIKGYETDKDKEKYKGVKDISLKILYKKDIQHMINYVTFKYGNDYIKLYEKDLVD